MSSERLILAWATSTAAFALFCAYVFFLSSHTASLEGNLGVRAWKPDAPSENNFFFDEAYLNYQGRERFAHEFKNWLKSGP